MSWHAVDAVDDAVETTHRFLFPFGLVRWAKLGFLVLLTGGGIGANVSIPFGPRLEFTAIPDDISWASTVLNGTLLADVDTRLVIAAVAAVVLVGTVLGIGSLSLRLAYYDALRTNAVRVWRPFIRRLGQAAGLFVFTTAVSAVFLVPVAAVVLVGAGIGWGPISAAGDLAAGSSAAELAVLGVLVVPVAVAVVLTLRITGEFVVPVMVLRDDGVLAAWRGVLTTLRRSPREFVVYLLVHFAFSVGLAVARSAALLVVVGTVAAAAAVALAVAAAVLGGLDALTGTTVGVAVLVAVPALGFTTVVLASVPVRILTRTFLTVYEASTLGRIDPDLALLASEIDPTTDPGSVA